MMSRAKRCSEDFSGFPAASLPRLRFDRKIAYKELIRNDFSVRSEPRKKFFP
jgi:hypothetical protein